MIIFRVGQTQLHTMRSILNGSRKYYIALALAGALIFSPLMLHTKAQAEGFMGPDKVYSIRSVLSRKALDIDLRWFRGREDGLRLIQWDYHGGSNQLFKITSAGDGCYFIMALNSNSFLDVDISGASTPDGPVLQQWQFTGYANQMFRIIPDSGYYRIVARHNERSLDVRNNSRDSGAQIFAAVHDTKACRTRDSQLFSFVQIQ